MKEITNNSFVQRSIVYLISFVMIGLFFAYLFGLELDFSVVLAQIFNNLP